MVMVNKSEFQEIAHSGGQLTIHVGVDGQGRRGYNIKWSNSRPVPAGVFAVYALPQGIAVGQINLGGMGSSPNPAPFPGCFPVFIGSDTEGRFGHQCPHCNGYWRNDGGGQFCPYCGLRGQFHDFLTTAQRSYVRQCCSMMAEVLDAGIEGDYVINMDEVADAAGKDITKPPFYYSEERQQNGFTYDACGGFNDILGRFGYCSVCGTTNDLQEFVETMTLTRRRIDSEGACEACVRDTVAAFDSLIGRYVKQLIQRVPMTAARINRLQAKRFHNLQSAAAELREVFDIRILDGIPDQDVKFAALMFHQRHVYEHRGGEADEKYITDSGDTSVRPKQMLRETPQSAHQLVNLVLRMAGNVHRVFHEMLPPDEQPVQRYQQMKRRS